MVIRSIPSPKLVEKPSANDELVGEVNDGERVVNATAGAVSLEALELAGEDNLKDKVLVDISNPLDFSQGMPPYALGVEHRLAG